MQADHSNEARQAPGEARKRTSIAAFSVIIFLAACGANVSTSQGTQPSPSTSAGPPTTTLTSAPPMCAPGQVSVTSAFVGGGAGSQYVVYTLTAAGGVSCAVQGIPSILDVSGSGATVTAFTTDATAEQTEAAAHPGQVDISQAAVASFYVQYMTCPSYNFSNEGQPATLVITLPGVGAEDLPVTTTGCSEASAFVSSIRSGNVSIPGLTPLNEGSPPPTGGPITPKTGTLPSP